MTGAGAPSAQIQATLAKSVNFEITLADMARRSERRAWWVAWSAVSLAILLAGGYVLLLPLKERVPFLVMADAYTGTSTVARLANGLHTSEITRSEAINKSNVAHFVIARESYDAGLVSRRDWTTVWTMSSPGVAAAFRDLHARSNPYSPVNTHGKAAAIRVEILSLVLIGGEGSKTPSGATVRFQRTLFDKINGTSTLLDNKIATLQFEYNDHLALDDTQRIENPLGFQVTQYRVDNDFVATPPLAKRQGVQEAGEPTPFESSPGAGLPVDEADTTVAASIEGDAYGANAP